jgi:hypothetical protein
MKTMTMRERILALVQGREHDRVPFVQYSHISFARDDEVWARIGRENMGILRWVNVHRFETPHCRFESEDVVREGRKTLRRTLVTPAGRLTEERLYEPVYGTTGPATHFIRQPEDYRVLLAYLRDIHVVMDLTPLRQNLDELGDDGLPHTYTLRTPYQQLWIEWVDIRDLAVHLVECPDLMDEVITAMTSVQRRVHEVVCQAVLEAPIPYVVVGDNITAPMIGPEYFRRYCVPAYDELAGMLDATGRDVPVFVHMDGNLKPLWEAIGQSRVRGLDSLSPPPDNDTSVADVVARWPEMRVWINFPSSVHLAPPETIYRHAMRILQEGGHTGRLQIQISENVPPGVWQTSYPQIVRAIADFGPVRPG